MSEAIDLSKGWMQRPGDVDAYAEGYERIFGKKSTKPVHSCIICGTTENVVFHGHWVGYRCDTAECQTV